MSHVTDVTVILRFPDDQGVVDYVGHFDWDGDGQPRQAWLLQLDTSPDAVGGQKVYTDQVYAAWFNHLPVDRFIAHLATAPWAEDSMSIVALYTEGGYSALFRPGHNLIEERR